MSGGRHAVSIGALLLSDARFPAGGHAHSGGVEPAVTAGTVTDVGSLEVFLHGRLRTAGVVAAAVAAAACVRARETDGAVWADLDAETDARTPSPAQREASRRQGRALLRAARAAWPDARWLGRLSTPSPVPQTFDEYRGGPHHAVVLGAAAAAAGCTPLEAAQIAAYQAVAGPASAAVRLLALDPMQATAVLARLGDMITARSREAAGWGEAAGWAEAARRGEAAEKAEGAEAAEGALAELPCPSAPGLDLLAEAHVAAEVRLFES
jgi:urease accessory protein